MGDILKSPRFWLSLAIIGAVTVLALYKLIQTLHRRYAAGHDDVIDIIILAGRKEEL